MNCDAQITSPVPLKCAVIPIDAKVIPVIGRSGRALLGPSTTAGSAAGPFSASTAIIDQNTRGMVPLFTGGMDRSRS